MLCMGGRSLAGGCCAGRKASSAGCCGVVLVLVAPGLDPADSPAVVAQEELSTVRGVLKRFCRCLIRCVHRISRTPDVTYDTIDQTICVPWRARTSRLVTCLVAVNVWCPCLFCLLVVPTLMLFRPF